MSIFCSKCSSNSFVKYGKKDNKQKYKCKISYWIKKAGEIAEKEFRKKQVNIEKKDIAVVEIDELCTYIKKNLLGVQKTKQNIHLFGLLWTETQEKFLILK